MAAERAESEDRISGKVCFYGYVRKPGRNPGGTGKGIENTK